MKAPKSMPTREPLEYVNEHGVECRVYFSTWCTNHERCTEQGWTISRYGFMRDRLIQSGAWHDHPVRLEQMTLEFA